MKTHVDRIVYYMRKANEYGALRFDYLRGRSVSKPPATRFKRLMTYKAAIKRALKGE